MIHQLVPEHGVRVLLERLSALPERVVYRVELHVPEASHRGEVSIDVVKGALALGAWETVRGEGEPEAWAIDAARAFLRTLHKNHAADGDWPRRQLRWRERK